MHIIKIMLPLLSKLFAAPRLWCAIELISNPLIL